MHIETKLPQFQIRGDGETKDAEIDLICFPFNLDFAGRTPKEVNAWMEVADVVEIEPLGAGDTLVGNFTTSTSDNRIICAGHGLVIDDQVRFDGTLPPPLAVETFYFVVGARGGDFQVAATAGGAVIDLTAQGNGQIFKRAELPDEPVLEQLLALARGSLVFLEFTNPIPRGKLRNIHMTIFTDLTVVSAPPAYQR